MSDSSSEAASGRLLVLLHLRRDARGVWGTRAAKQEALAADLIALADKFNRATDGTL
jgi:hypothetical protein